MQKSNIEDKHFVAVPNYIIFMIDCKDDLKKNIVYHPGQKLVDRIVFIYLTNSRKLLKTTRAMTFNDKTKINELQG